MLSEESSAYSIAASKVLTIKKFVEAYNCDMETMDLIRKFIKYNSNSYTLIKVRVTFDHKNNIDN